MSFRVSAWIMSLGYYDEARAWRDWLTRAIAGSPRQVQIMYGVGGERWLPELIVPWLAGYEKSAPVRIGNDASGQLQLDVFGEIADAIFQTVKAGMEPPERGGPSCWNICRRRGGNRTKASGRSAADGNTSSTRR
jgi:GH15 family glucan-1,4-alpha-glucosidase